MRKRTAIRQATECLVAIVLTSTATFAGTTPSVVHAGETVQCEALKSIDLAGVKDAPSQVRSIQAIEATPQSIAHCKVAVSVTADFDFEIHLPQAAWNGKFLMVPSVPSDACRGYLKRGYACVPLYRNGRKERTDSEFANLLLRDPAAMLDWHRFAHISALASHALIGEFYGQPIERSYLMGCSAGGYTALSEAQRFPWDFDGIVAVAADTDLADWLLRAAWSSRYVRKLDERDLALLHKSTLAQCDQDDAIQDGIVSNPLGCKVQPEKLLCKTGQTFGCLSRDKINAAVRIYGGPSNSAREQISIRPSLLPGSELDWGWLGSQAWLSFVQPYFRLGFYGASPALQPDRLNFDEDYKRGGLGEVLAPPNNPNLRNFKAAGGKLLAVQGANDVAQVVGQMLDYYEIAEKTMGGTAATQEFFRFFMVPGMGHCVGGTGAWAIDYLSYLEDWVEKGRAPDSMVGAHVVQKGEGATQSLEFPLHASTEIAFTRPVYLYPRYAKYKGVGNPKDAVNFAPVDPTIDRDTRQ